MHAVVTRAQALLHDCVAGSWGEEAVVPLGQVRFAPPLTPPRMLCFSVYETHLRQAFEAAVTLQAGRFIGGTKPLGEGRYELAVWGTATVTGLVFDESVLGEVVGEWGSRSLRTFAVGAPPLYVLQLATGASRPADGHGSHWHWFNDNNGVSGHAFIGAVPFLAAAEMVENPWAKGSLYVCSTF